MEAAYLALAGSFGLFYAYDWCTVRRPHFAFLRWGFGAGCLLLFGGLVLVWTACFSPLRLPAVAGFGAVGLVFAALLAHALFFSLPQGTYADPTAPRHVYDRRMYALCRHPGFLWLTGLCLCLGGALGRGSLGALGLVCALNFFYIVLQDCWTFPHIFCDYEDYRRRVPFLWPTRTSARVCLKQYREGKD